MIKRNKEIFLYKTFCTRNTPVHENVQFQRSFLIFLSDSPTGEKLRCPFLDTIPLGFRRCLADRVDEKIENVLF